MENEIFMRPDNWNWTLVKCVIVVYGRKNSMHQAQRILKIIYTIKMHNIQPKYVCIRSQLGETFY